MAPKKRNTEGRTQDIRTFCKKENDIPGSGTTSKKPRQATTNKMLPMRVKEEEEPCVSAQGQHSHLIKVKFGPEDCTYNIHCNQPRTLLEAIKSHLPSDFKDKIKCEDEKIIIKRGKGDNTSLVATHFPCSCLNDGECVTIRATTKVVEAQQQQKYSVQEKEKYVIFYIDKEGGKDSKSKAKQIFRCTNIAEEFKYFCVYGLKEMTVEQVLNQDGRFKNLTGFCLSNSNENNDATKCTEIVKRLNKGRYKICLPKEGRSKGIDPKQETSNEQQTEQENQQLHNDSQLTAVEDPQCSPETRRVLEVAREKTISLKLAVKETSSTINLKEIHNLLLRQFPKLKELMEKRFPGQSFREALNRQKENFGKIQQAFSEVHRMRELLELGRSVCLLMIRDTTSSLVVQGTGFVLFDNFILTNAHLFIPWATNGIEKWWEHVEITAKFNFEKPETGSRPKFEAKLFDGSQDLDYAILTLIPINQNTDQATETEEDKVPPGLLRKFGPLPFDGHACLIGHPAGEVKKMDPTCVIQKEERDQAVDQNLESHKDYIFTIYAIKNKMESDPKADICVTYNTFMYHGASGSPVFDAYGQVFGMHTGSFFFGFPKPDDSVIEYAFPLLAIYEKFVCALKEKGNFKLLKRVQEESKGNRYLEKIMESVVDLKESTHEVEGSQSVIEIAEAESLDSVESMEMS